LKLSFRILKYVCVFFVVAILRAWISVPQFSSEQTDLCGLQSYLCGTKERVEHWCTWWLFEKDDWGLLLAGQLSIFLQSLTRQCSSCAKRKHSLKTHIFLISSVCSMLQLLCYTREFYFALSMYIHSHLESAYLYLIDFSEWTSCSSSTQFTFDYFHETI